MKPVWARNIMARRKALGFRSAEKFSELIDLPYPTYRDIENGKSEGIYANRLAIAKGLKCTVSDLYRDSHGPVIIEHVKQVADFLNVFSSSSSDVQKVVLALLYDDESRLEGCKISSVYPLSRWLKSV